MKALEQRVLSLESENRALRAAGGAAQGWHGLLAAASGVHAAISDLEERNGKLAQELEAAKSCIPMCVSQGPKSEYVCCTDL